MNRSNTPGLASDGSWDDLWDFLCKQHVNIKHMTGWWLTYPSENMKVSWDDSSQYMEYIYIYKLFQTTNQMSKINPANIIQFKYPELVVSIYPKKYESLWTSIGIFLELRDIKLRKPTNTDGNKL